MPYFFHHDDKSTTLDIYVNNAIDLSKIDNRIQTLEDSYKFPMHLSLRVPNYCMNEIMEKLKREKAIVSINGEFTPAFKEDYDAAFVQASRVGC